MLGKDREGYSEEIIGQINIESGGKLDQRREVYNTETGGVAKMHRRVLVIFHQQSCVD